MPEKSHRLWPVSKREKTRQKKESYILLNYDSEGSTELRQSHGGSAITAPRVETLGKKGPLSCQRTIIPPISLAQLQAP